MVIFVYGTTGELIKLLPLIKSIPEEEQFRISTEQQPKQLKLLSKGASVPEPAIKIANGRQGNDLEKKVDMLFWLLKIVRNYHTVSRHLKSLKKQSNDKLLVVVHGDTITTVLGALFGRLHRLPVAHIEAGLRSGNWRHPFPEELDRRIVSKIATRHFAPGDIPVSNLHQAKAKGKIVNTRYNTVLDSLRLARSDPVSIEGINALPSSYFVVSIHRNELMAQPDELKRTLQNIADQSKKITCIFLDHPVTKERIKNLKLDYLLDKKNLVRLPKLQYFQFISLIARCSFIVTDSGGLQEEAAYLGIPCLVHRLTTERNEGLGKNVVLSLYKEDKVKAFLNNPTKYHIKGLADKTSPTTIIVDRLIAEGYISSSN